MNLEHILNPCDELHSQRPGSRLTGSTVHQGDQDDTGDSSTVHETGQESSGNSSTTHHANQGASEQGSTSASKNGRSKARKTDNAAEFVKGSVVGEVNFPPYETSNSELKQGLVSFQIHPPSGIAEYPRSVPYSSTKKEFRAMTGRERFEVFRYSFRHGEETFWVVWDYNIGIVRVTSFFKSLGYPKTMTNKAIETTPGLKDISWSITGGVLLIQGYWLPYEAAKALAATFCWKIRYALVPIFGEDFPALCEPVQNRDDVQFAIPTDVVERCSREVNSWTYSDPENDVEDEEMNDEEEEEEGEEEEDEEEEGEEEEAEGEEEEDEDEGETHEKSSQDQGNENDDQDYRQERVVPTPQQAPPPRYGFGPWNNRGPGVRLPIPRRVSGNPSHFTPFHHGYNAEAHTTEFRFEITAEDIEAAETLVRMSRGER